MTTFILVANTNPLTDLFAVKNNPRNMYINFAEKSAVSCYQLINKPMRVFRTKTHKTDREKEKKRERDRQRQTGRQTDLKNSQTYEVKIRIEQQRKQIYAIE